MKSVLISIQPKWCELIASGKKTVEVRKTKPKLETPFKVYIYCTKSNNQFLQSRNNMYFYCEDRDFIGGHGAGAYQRLNGKVIGEFVCDRITEYECSSEGHGQLATTCETCLTYDEIINYCNGNELYGWHISDLVIYDKPKELSEFYTETCISFSNGFCTAPKFECDFQHYIYQGNIEPCVKKLTRPPQSWCYVESLRSDIE